MRVSAVQPYNPPNESKDSLNRMPGMNWRRKPLSTAPSGQCEDTFLEAASARREGGPPQVQRGAFRDPERILA